MHDVARKLTVKRSQSLRQTSVGPSQLVQATRASGQTIAHAFGDSNTTGSAMISGNSIYGSASTTSSGIAIAERRYCVVNVVMAGNSVSVVNYSGPTGGLLTGGEQCAYVVRGCVKK